MIKFTIGKFALLYFKYTGYTDDHQLPSDDFHTSPPYFLQSFVSLSQFDGVGLFSLKDLLAGVYASLCLHLYLTESLI